MTTRRNFVGALGTVFFSPSWAMLASAEAKIRLAIVVAKNSPLNEISLQDLKNLYRGDKLSGPKLIPFAFAAGLPERVAFDQAVLGYSPREMAQYWIDRKIRGQSGPPQTIDSAEVVMKVVANLPGSLGYVRVSELKPYVKALRIDGKAVTDEGYPVEA